MGLSAICTSDLTASGEVAIILMESRENFVFANSCRSVPCFFPDKAVWRSYGFHGKTLHFVCTMPRTEPPSYASRMDTTRGSHDCRIAAVTSTCDDDEVS
jgi:hypothetical protein